MVYGGFCREWAESSAFAMEMTRRGIRCDSKREFPALIPGAWKPAHNAGSHISTATTAAGSLSAMKINPAKIAGFFRFLHRTNFLERQCAYIETETKRLGISVSDLVSRIFDADIDAEEHAGRWRWARSKEESKQ